MTDYEKMKQLFTEFNIYFNEYKNDGEIIQLHEEYYISHFFNGDGKYLYSRAGENH